MKKKVAPPTLPPPPSCRNAGGNHNWVSELRVTWPLRDLELTRGLASPPSCSLVVLCGCAPARYCLEGRRACSTGKEEVVEADPDRLQVSGSVGAADFKAKRRRLLLSLQVSGCLGPSGLGFIGDHDRIWETHCPSCRS
ncbi:hypothetical protein VULLAG_LOCUS16770 [Vulpes lagopus]